ASTARCRSACRRRGRKTPACRCRCRKSVGKVPDMNHDAVLNVTLTVLAVLLWFVVFFLSQ
ncbi:hypothetical protein M0741_24620, partial [Salmonella enterica subsp. enterica serovar Oranienburg]|nr:hypothetical protein [Salmonella enterica subsp. enterica serovar Oranienburg]